MNYYSFEKGKYGGPCGAIFPFFRTLNGLSALGEDYINYVPAGYLKCRGQVLSANDYPNLARLMGVGTTCLYKKPNTILLDPNEDGTGGTFQLPDLGSKYITGSSSSGIYLNNTTFNPASSSEIDRAGVEIEISSQGSTVEFFYTGDFKVPGRTIALTGNMTAASPPTSTDQETVSIGQTLAHGHYSDMKIAKRINYRTDAMAYATFRRAYICGKNGRRICESDEDFGISHKGVVLTEEGSDASTNHRHYGVFPIKTGESKAASTSDLLISAGPLVTTVNVNTANTIKMDDIAPKFILCEYLIKF